ncbi:suppressor of lurcher protein 1 [Caerostris darwini]|uniref:Suppressor of lurcher protein 1 n=1 Tax=Caerostris darwini TaxID=1538125 RepID=A0AAV4RXW2_9ARAC|nr:suppressor of lurcher protein 1 [Caerostris darwini]
MPVSLQPKSVGPSNMFVLIVSFPCGHEFSSDVSKNGTFTSPNYPEPYPEDVYCVYSFMGRGKERVQIQFTDFDLHLPHEPPRDCDSVDAVMVFITINGQKERVDNFCGNKLPAQLMSNGPSMLVEFRSYHSSPEVKGFRAIFKFVTDLLEIFFSGSFLSGPDEDPDSIGHFSVSGLSLEMPSTGIKGNH